MLLNGEVVEDEKIILDSGFLFGRGLFETMLVKEEPLFLREHLERINKGLPLIGIDKKISAEEVLDAAEKLQCRGRVLKMAVTEKNTLFTTRENRYKPEHNSRGFNVGISQVMRNESSPLTYLKSLNYLDNILEHERCVSQGLDEVLFFNSRGMLCEGSVSNVFFVKGDRIFTPAVECGLLGGVVRKFILDSFDVTEGSFGREELHKADAAFLTNSVMGIMKIAEIDGKCYGGNDILGAIKAEYDRKTI
jgi:4-amino-4-deoxychorismate lyase